MKIRKDLVLRCGIVNVICWQANSTLSGFSLIRCCEPFSKGRRRIKTQKSNFRFQKFNNNHCWLTCNFFQKLNKRKFNNSFENFRPSHSAFIWIEFESISKIPKTYKNSFDNFVTDRFGTECLMWFREFFFTLIQLSLGSEPIIHFLSYNSICKSNSTEYISTGFW